MNKVNYLLVTKYKLTLDFFLGPGATPLMRLPGPAFFSPDSFIRLYNRCSNTHRREKKFSLDKTIFIWASRFGLLLGRKSIDVKSSL